MHSMTAPPGECHDKFHRVVFPPVEGDDGVDDRRQGTLHQTGDVTRQ